MSSTPHRDAFIRLADQLKDASEAKHPQAECRDLLWQLVREIDLIEAED